MLSLVPYLLAAAVMFSTGSGGVSGLYLPKHAGRLQPLMLYTAMHWMQLIYETQHTLILNQL